MMFERQEGRVQILKKPTVSSTQNLSLHRNIVKGFGWKRQYVGILENHLMTAWSKDHSEWKHSNVRVSCCNR